MNIENYNRKLTNSLSELSGHLMNDSKWRKVFRLISSIDFNVKNVKIVSVWNDSDSTNNELNIEHLENYNETFNEKGINDILIGGPLYFKEIKKIIIHSDSIELLISSINELGILETEKFENKLTLIGYK
jgi:hypothetical protein